MKTFAFYAQGVPKGQPRAKAAAFRPRGGKGVVRARMYDPGTADDWKASVKRAAHDAGATNAFLSGPISLSLRIIFPRPKSHYRSGKNAHLLRDDAPHYHASKPDRDNADKAIMDALTDACVWHDDCQVCSGRIVKIYGANPGAEILIRQLEDKPPHEH